MPTCQILRPQSEEDRAGPCYRAALALSWPSSVIVLAYTQACDANGLGMCLWRAMDGMDGSCQAHEAKVSCVWRGGGRRGHGEARAQAAK